MAVRQHIGRFHRQREMDAIDQEFCRMTEDILSHPLFLKMREQCHHGGENSLYIHSLSTAECAYRMARRFRMKEARVRAVTRAALLHDFFGYDWQSEEHRRFLRHYTGWNRVKHMHAFIHGALAARRADRVFGLDERQRAAITSHMCPLAPFPKSSEAWVITLADKYVASKEVSAAVGWHIKQLYRKIA